MTARKVGTVVVAAAAAALLAACSSSGSTGSGGGGGDYVIGFSDGITGPTAAFGAPSAKVAKAVFDAVNADGGVNGHKIKFISLDQGSPGSGKAAVNVTQLITQDHAIAVLGQSISNDCSSVEAIATRNKVPLLCQRVPTSDLKPVKKYVYNDTDSEISEVQPQIALIKKLVSKPNPRVAVIGNDNIGTNTWAAAVQKAIKAAGGTVTAYQNMSETATSVSANTAAIVASKPDIVVGEIFQQFWAPLIKGMQAAGQDVPYIGTSGDIFYSDLATLKNPNVYLASITAPFDPNTTNADEKKLIAQLNKAGMSSANDLNVGSGSYTAVGPAAIVAALQKCGYPCSGQKLADALETSTTDVFGLAPEGYGYSADSHFGVKRFYYYHWDDSKKAIVSGFDVAPGDPVTGAAGS